MNNLAVNNLSLVFAFSLVVVSLGIVYKEKLGLEKDIIYSVIRAIIQLVIVGYILKYVFNINNIILTLVMMFIVFFNASYSAYKKSAGIPHSFQISFIAIFCSTSVTLGLLLLAGTLKFIPSQIIPITGMIASNSMVAIGLCYRNLNSNFRDQRQQILEKLALGADLKQASYPIIRESIKTGMSPTIDSAKTVGIVSLPGMMSGLIFAGVDPVFAIKYQIMVTFMLLSATRISSITVCYLSYKQFFNDKKQLR